MKDAKISRALVPSLIEAEIDSSSRLHHCMNASTEDATSR